MENSSIVRAFWKWAQLDGEDAWTELAEFESFPSNDSYSKRAWELILKIARLISPSFPVQALLRQVGEAMI